MDANCPKCHQPADKAFEQTVYVYDGESYDTETLVAMMRDGTLPQKTMLMTECRDCGNFSTEAIASR